MTDEKKDFGPLWQLEQQIKHYDALAAAHGGEATRSMQRAEDARNMASRYREAYERLKE